MILWTALFLWLGALCWFLYIRMSPTDARLRRRIRFKPCNESGSSQLFCSLLSGSLAVLERDDFNRLESALTVRQARHLLANYWNIDSRESWLRAIEARLHGLGERSTRERVLLDQWREGNFFDTEGRDPLQDVCTFLSMEACVVGPREIGAHHMNPMAWDIQQAAYAVRLGLAAGYAPTGVARNVMDRLQAEVRLHYGSWSDYFLSSLIGMGLRHHVDIFSPGDWHRIAQTYTVLVSSSEGLLRHASTWSSTKVDEPINPTAVLDSGRRIGHVDGANQASVHFPA
ncbi:MAG: DUF1266 domain-containing protein [Pseudomonadota bacterium]